MSDSLGRTVTVPLDYAAPAWGRADLYVEFGAPFDRSKPTVIVVEDGQQFFVRRGEMVKMQASLFGNRLNVLGIVPRGATHAFVAAARRADGSPDWAKAWRIFHSDQWVEDIDRVRRTVLGPRTHVLLYGRSGGGYLVHQYLLRHGDVVMRAFTQAPVAPALNRELGIPIEHFWMELGAQDPRLQTALTRALAANPHERLRILVALQRQHFFIPADSLPTARAALIHALAAGDSAAFKRARADYQVDEILGLQHSDEALAENVRVYELIAPSGEFRPRDGATIEPLIDSQSEFVRPLIDLANAGKIAPTSFDLRRAHRLNTEVLVLTGRWDDAVDYRTSIALAASYPHHHLFLADDNHVLTRLTQAGLNRRLVQAFLEGGLRSSEFERELVAAESYRWRE
jgi:pimeloyl-ACP methyl ester carboxylesterase